jgi:hypothetical protein
MSLCLFPVRQNNINWRDRGCPGYQYKRDNVVLQYTEESTAETAIATYTSGSATFVSLDSAVPQQLLPSGLVQLPLAGVPLVMAYNLPSLDSATQRLVLSHFPKP